MRDAADGLLRDFAAKCLSEFLKWSLVNSRGKPARERGDGKVESGQTNAKQMFRKLFR